MDEQDVLHKNLLDVFMFKENQQSTLVQALQKEKKRLTSNKRISTIKDKKSRRLIIPSLF